LTIAPAPAKSNPGTVTDSLSALNWRLHVDVPLRTSIGWTAYEYATPGWTALSTHVTSPFVRVGTSEVVQTSIADPPTIVRRTRYSTIDVPGKETGGQRKWITDPSTDANGVGATPGEKLPTSRIDSREVLREENLADVRAGAMKATVTKVANRALQPRFTFEHQLQTMLVHCLPATHDVV
jgi:hypothetical protein